MKGISEYHKARLLMHVADILGHKSVESTKVYVHMEKATYQSGINDEFHIKVASTKDEIVGLLGTGYEYVMTKDGLTYFRKRK